MLHLPNRAYNSTSRNKMKHFIYNPIIESNTKIKRHEKLNLLGKWKEINVNDIQTDICITFSATHDIIKRNNTTFS